MRVWRALSFLDNQFNLSLIGPCYVVAQNCHHLTGTWWMLKFCCQIYFLGKSEPIFPSYLYHTVVFSQSPFSRFNIWIQEKSATDVMYNHPYHIGNVLFPPESCRIPLQSSYSSKNCIKNVCLTDKGRSRGFPFTSLLSQTNSTL